LALEVVRSEAPASDRAGSVETDRDRTSAPRGPSIKKVRGSNFLSSTLRKSRLTSANTAGGPGFFRCHSPLLRSGAPPARPGASDARGRPGPRTTRGGAGRCSWSRSTCPASSTTSGTPPRPVAAMARAHRVRGAGPSGFLPAGDMASPISPHTRDSSAAAPPALWAPSSSMSSNGSTSIEPAAASPSANRPCGPRRR
jgi:hypothetical protein